jgi:hypothetical protein
MKFSFPIWEMLNLPGGLPLVRARPGVRSGHLNQLGGFIMMGFMIETVVVAFAMGGILGAITALHVSSERNGELVKIEQRDSRYMHRRR